MIELALNAVGGGVVLYASFCRLVHTNQRTRVGVRLAVWAVSTVAVMALLGPVLTAWRPDMLHALLLCAFAMHLVVGSRVWRYGVPHSFQRGL